MKNFNEYDIQKNNLIDKLTTSEKIFEELSANRKIDITEKKRDSIKDISKDIAAKCQSLINNNFKIAVAGQIKSGKSTLLNSILFENDILPEGVNPCTAKLTFITFGEKEEYSVDNFTENEWNEWKKEAAKCTRADFEDITKRGDFLTSYLGNENCPVQKVELNNYVAKGGKYTPIVKNLNIKWNADWLKDVEVVDTPGTNDPFIMRSKIAEDFIEKADAILYVLYAKQAFSTEDKEILEDIILKSGKSAKNIVIAINQKDTLGNSSDEVKNFVNNALKDLKEDLSKSPISFTSGKIARIAQKLDHEIPLDDSEDNLLEKVEDDLDDSSPEALIEYSGILKLKKDLESYLVKNKGQLTIDNNRDFLINKKNSVLQILENKVSSLNKLKESFEIGSKELTQKKIEISNTQKAIGEKKDELIVKRFNIKKRRKFKEEIYDKFLEDIIDDIKKHAEGLISEFDLNIEISLDNILDKNFEETYKNEVQKLNKKLDDRFEENKKNLGKQIESSVINIYNNKLKDYYKEYIEGLKESWEEDIKKMLENCKSSGYDIEDIIFSWYKFKDMLENKIKDLLEGIKKINETINASTELDDDFKNKIETHIRKYWFKHRDGYKPLKAELNEKYKEKRKEISKMYKEEWEKKIVNGYLKNDFKPTIREFLANDIFDEIEDMFKEEYEYISDDIETYLDELNDNYKLVEEKIKNHELRKEEETKEIEIKIAHLIDNINNIKNI